MTEVGVTAPVHRAAVDTPLLQVSDLGIDVQRADGATRLLEDVSFSIESGKTLGVVGETGSGKSITAAAVMQLLPNRLTVSTGTVLFEGRDLAALDEPQLRAIRGNEIGMVFQDPQACLNPAYTVGNQMVEAIRAHTGMSKKAALAHAISLLDRVGIHRAGDRIKDYPHQLSGGMAQRVMIAIAICCDPKLLIADEPTTALDVTVQAQILALLRRLQADTGMGLLIISHDLSVIAEMADDVAVMYAGQLVERGPIEATFLDPTHPYTEALLAAQPEAARKGAPMATIAGIVPNADRLPPGCRFSPRCQHATDECRTTRPALEASAGHEHTVSRCLYRHSLGLIGLDRLDGVAAPDTTLTDTARTPVDNAPGPQVLLQVDRLGKTFRLRGGGLFTKPSLHAVDDVTFELHEGETLGLVGESGAGKSTVGRMVLGLTEPSTGAVRIDGTDLRRQHRRVRRSTRGDVQVVFQNPYASLDPMMTVGASIAEPLEVHDWGTGSEREARVAELLSQVGLDRSAAQRRPHELSGGQRQRVAIARSLALKPRLIVCDEPVSALDVSTQAQVINLLRDLQAQFGIAYLFVGHDLSVVHQISDRIAVMFHGRVVEIGPADQVYSRPTHPYTKALLGAVLSIDPRKRRLAPATTQLPPEPSPTGCSFATRCPAAMAHCASVDPHPTDVGHGVTVSCHLFSDSPTSRGTDA